MRLSSSITQLLFKAVSLEEIWVIMTLLRAPEFQNEFASRPTIMTAGDRR